MVECIQTLEVCQGSRDLQPYAFNLTADFARAWEPDHPFPAAVAVRPIYRLGRPTTGLEYVSSGGQSGGGREPPWPTVAGGTVRDGTITWTAQALSNASLRWRIATVAWDTVADLVLSDQVETDDPGLQEVRVKANGGTPGEVYTNPGLVTTVDGNVFEIRLEVTVTE